MKTCTKCKRELPATREYFYKDSRATDDLTSECKRCHYKCTTKWRKKNKSRWNDYKRKWLKSNREKDNKYQRKKYRRIKHYLVVVWNNINYRCYNPKAHNYHRYGGRGIQNRFNNLDEFRNYVMNTLGFDTYNKIKGLQIDRINNDGHYELGNIRFIISKVNNNNKGD